MRRLSTTLNALAFLWASAATIYLLSTSGHEGVTTTSTLTGSETVAGHIDVSLVSANGPWVVALLLLVTLVAGLPFGVAVTYPKGRRAVTWTAGAVLLGFSIISGFTVGLMYLPVSVVLLASAAVTVSVRGDRGGMGLDATGT